MNTKKILIIGGHITPALSVIEKIEKDKNWVIMCIGRKYAIEGNESTSFEYNEVTKRKIKFYNINSPKIKRDQIIRSLLKLPLLALAIYESIKIIRKEKPDCIVSFGGYLAVPVCLAGKMEKIPILTHEQTMTVGVANSIIARFARTVCLSWQDNKIKNMPNLVVTGNPVRGEFFRKTERPDFWPKTDGPILYITGGNLGSHVLNELVAKNLRALCEKYTLIHQTGNSTEFQDFEKLEKKSEELPDNLKKKYIPKKYMTVSEASYVFQNADVLIGRAGANTVAEIMITKIPSILIPLPWAGGGEQEKQASFIEQNGLGRKIRQNDLSLERLNQEIKFCLENKGKIKKTFSDVPEGLRIKDAAENILKEIDALMVQ